MGKRSEVEELRAEVAGRQGRGTLTRYGAAVREAALRVMAERRQQGETVRAVSTEVGVPWRTLLRWERIASARASSKSEAAFRRVKMVPAAAAASQSFVLRGPAGLTVTGLTVGELAALLRSLGS